MNIICFWMAALIFFQATPTMAQCDTVHTVADPVDPVTILLSPAGEGQNWLLPFATLSTDEYAEVSEMPFNLIDPSVFRDSHPFELPVSDTIRMDTTEVSVGGNTMMRIGSAVSSYDASGVMTIGETTYDLQRVHVHEEYFYLIPADLLATTDGPSEDPGIETGDGGEEEPGGEDEEGSSTTTESEPKDERFVFIADCYYWYQEGSSTPLVAYQTLTQQFGPVSNHYKHLFIIWPEGRPAVPSPAAAPTFICTPNPAQNSLTVTYSLPKPTDVTVSIQNMIGVKRTLLQVARQDEGVHAFHTDLSSYPPGHYIVTLQADKQAFSQKLLKK